MEFSQYLRTKMQAISIKSAKDTKINQYEQIIIRDKIITTELFIVDIDFLIDYLNTPLGGSLMRNGIEIKRCPDGIYEQLDRKIVKFYLDIDFYFNGELQKNIHNDIIKAVAEKVGVKIEDVITFSNIRKIGDENKFSIHIHVEKYYLTSAHLKQYLEDIKLNEELQKINDNLKIDDSVYSKGRCFRVPLTAKHNQDGSLDYNSALKIDKNIDADSMFVTAIPQEAKIENIIIKEKEKIIVETNIISEDNKKINNLKLEKNILKYYSFLQNKIKFLDNYAQWISALYLIRNETKNIELAISVSKLSGKFDEKSLVTIKNIFDNCEKSEIHIASLFHLLNTNNYYGDKTQLNRAKFLDMKCATSFQQIIQNLKEKRKINIKYPEYKIISHLQRCIGITSNGRKTIYMKILKNNKTDEPESSLYEFKLNEFKNDFIYEKIKYSHKREKREKTFFKIIMENSAMFEYSFCGLFPNLYPANHSKNGGPGINVINLFSGYAAIPMAPITEQDFKYLEIFKYHIHEILCCGNASYSKFLTSWFAFIYQYPGLKSKIAVVLRNNKQQCGKGIICNLFAKYILGNKYCAFSSDINEIIGDFNGYLLDKVFVNFDETKINLKNSDKMKNIITEYMGRSNKKFKDVTDEQNNINILITSNNMNPAPIEDGNARYFELKISEKKRGDLKYFNELAEAFQKGSGVIAHYLKNIELGNPENFAKTMPQTETTNANRIFTSFTHFMHDTYCTIEELEDTGNTFQEIKNCVRDEMSMKAAELYQCYLSSYNFRINQGISIKDSKMNYKSFLLEMEEMGFKKETVTKVLRFYISKDIVSNYARDNEL